MAGPRDPAPLVGRDGELDDVRAALTAAAGGAAAAVILSGPFGIGKTRLAQTALTMAGEAGFTVLAGRSTGPRSIRGAVTAALGRWLRERPEDRLATLVEGLPQLALLFSDLPLTAPPPLADPAMERARLEDGQVRLLERIVRLRPVALLLDDLHLAEPSTWSVLQQIVGRLGDEPVLLLVTVSADAEARPGRSTLTDVASLRGALRSEGWQLHEVALEPLDETDSSSLLSALLAATPGGAPVGLPTGPDAIRACGGRPLFIESVAAALIDGHGPTLTGDVRSQILARARGLGATARTVLELLSVVDVELPAEVVADAVRAHTGDPEADIGSALDLLARRRMAVESDGRYEPAHAFLRGTVRDALPPVARRRLLAAVAGAAERHRLLDPALVAGLGEAVALLEPPRALRLLRAAAGRARDLGEVEPAIGLLETAATIAAGAGLARDEAAIHGDLGDLLAWNGAAGPARAHWTDALAGWTSLGDPVATARAHRRLAELAWENGETAAARAHLDTAEESLGTTAAGPERMALAFARMVAASRTNDDAALERAADQLDLLSAQVHAPAYLARAQLARGASAILATDLVRASAWTRRGLVAAESAAEAPLMIRAHDQLSVIAGGEGDVAGFRRHSTASLDLARRLGSRTGEGWPLVRIAVADLLAGDWDAALRGTAELIAGAERLHAGRGLVSVLAVHGWVLTHRGRLAEAESLITRAERLLGAELITDRHIVWTVGLAATRWGLAVGDPVRAMRAAALIGRPVRGWLSLLALATYAEAAVAAGEHDLAADLAAEAGGLRSCATILPATVVAWIDGLLARAGEDQVRAGARFEEAADGFDALGLPYQGACCLLGRAEADADPDRSARLAAAALTTFDTLGAPLEAQQARTLLRRLGVTPSRGRPRADAVAGLSRRELEVARLVAAGLRNNEIATRLFISPRTVSTHLEHVYRRLGLTSRAALTRYLADSGQLDAD